MVHVEALYPGRFNFKFDQAAQDETIMIAGWARGRDFKPRRLTAAVRAHWQA